MRITKKQMMRIIREEMEHMLDAEHPSEIEPVEGVFGGDLEGEDRNLELPLDHAHVHSAGEKEVQAEPESLPDAPPVLESKSMRISRKHLARIIKEEKARLISEASREAKEGEILADFNMVVSAIEEIEKGMYGLVDPNAPGDTYGDELASDLGMQVARLNDLYGALQRHFESMDMEPVR